MNKEFNPYILPDGNVQIAFSGGRTSGYMLHNIIEANGGLPDRAKVIFANTGREMPETLDFVQECGERWGVQITWIEYFETVLENLPRRQRYVLVTRETASVNGEPFEALMIRKRGLPNQTVRFCTGELKIDVSRYYLEDNGWEKWSVALGIRVDEQRRLKPLKDERNIAWYPLADAGVGKQDVAAFWAKQAFDLRLPNINGRSPLGNCDGCFLKSEAALAALARDYPERFAWWERLENESPHLFGRQQTFRANRKYYEIRRFIDAQGDWIFEMEGVLCQANGGECTG